MRCVIDQLLLFFTAPSAGSIVIGMHGPGDVLHASGPLRAAPSRDQQQTCGI
jgi:hypothetical protein